MKQSQYSAKILIRKKLPCLVGLVLAPGLWAQVNVLTWHNDMARTGQNLQETVLSPSNVNSTNFGRLATLAVDGKVDAQPLYVSSLPISGGTHNVLYVATENDTLYAFDADSGAQLWAYSVLNGEQASDDRGCNQVTPKIGITSTPAIDLSSGPHGTIYLVAMTKDGSGNYHQRLHALDLVTHAEQFGGPMEVQATYHPPTGPNSAAGVTFDPKQYKDRAALLISNGIVYTSWASHCDIDPYSAWVIGYNESSLAQASVLNLTPNGPRGSIWQAGAGPAADAGGNLYFLMANGTFDAPPPALTATGFPSKGDYGNAFMNLSTTAGVAVADYFTMSNTVSESNGDTDLGSGGAILLPTLNDALGNPHALAVGAGKDGTGYVVDRNNMGKFNMNSNVVYQQLALGASVFSSPAWFNNTLYYGPVGLQIEAFPYSGGSFGPAAFQTSVSSGFAYPGATPSISANGSSNGIVWAVQTGSTAILYAFDASNLNKLYGSNQAAGSRDHFGAGITFATPTVANGKVYVGTTNGVGIFGLLNCSYSLIHSASFDANATSAGFGVTTTPGCSWSVSNSSNFITVTGGASGTGNGMVNIQIAANPGVARTGNLVIAGQTLIISQAGLTTTSGLGFYTLSPCRIADTRSAGGSGLTGPFGPPSISASTTRNFPIPASFCNVPTSAMAYSLNATVVPTSTLGYLTSWPTGQSLPTVATLNALTGGIVANAAIVSAGTDHAISVFPSDRTDVILDINGYFDVPNAPQALAFYPVTPCRVADTRGKGFTGAFGPPSLVSGATRDFSIPSSSCGIPSSAQGYSVRMTAIASNSLGFLTTWPSGQSRPKVATLNAPNGGVVGNEAIVPAGTAGAISVYASDNTDLVMDVNGYFAPPGSPGALYFYPLTPCRIADTRSGKGFSGAFGPPSLGGGTTRDFPLQSSSCGIPSSAQAYSLNMTVVAPNSLGFLTAWPSGQTRPVAATVNALNGGVVGSAAIVPAGTSGAVSVYASDNTDVIIDINGYFAP